MDVLVGRIGPTFGGKMNRVPLNSVVQVANRTFPSAFSTRGSIDTADDCRVPSYSSYSPWIPSLVSDVPLHHFDR